ncbi:PadR family transcriptional regulator [Paraburkholderia sediminicola]|uniref:PadR family transcriptional regulator n=1 Tax=Paraburkholderia rhynchosiae TaxID=487049 RepID=A0ACC7NFF2_9BURK
MRHPYRFSHPRSVDDDVNAGHERASLHALWHAFARHQTFHGGRGRAEFARRHGERDDWRGFHGNDQPPAEFASYESGRRGQREFQGDAPTREGRQGRQARRDFQADPRSHGRQAHHGHARFALHALWHATGPHHDAHGGGRGGRFGGGPGGFGGDGEGFPRGRKFSSDDLQLLLLSLIDAQPSHGYELIKALETRSNGFYSPSPGMVYPALTYLEELGYVTVQLEGNRKRYELAQAGRDYLAANRERVELMLARLTHIARKMDSVRRAFAGEEPADISEGGWLPELTEARRTLKHALLRRDNAPAAEQRRIAAILMRAAREIEGGDKADDAGNDANSEPTA